MAITLMIAAAVVDGKLAMSSVAAIAHYTSRRDGERKRDGEREEWDGDRNHDPGRVVGQGFSFSRQ